MEKSEKQEYKDLIDKREKGAKAIYETYKLLRKGPLRKLPEWTYGRVEISPEAPYY